MRKGLTNALRASVLGMPLLISFSPTVSAQDVVTDLSVHEVPIEWNFTGTQILLFGAMERSRITGERSEVIVVVRGPKRSLTARKKSKVAGVWANTQSEPFDAIPGYYSMASARPITKITSPLTLLKLGIGLEALTYQLSLRNGRLIDNQPDEFTKAIVRLMKVDGLYQENTSGVKILGDRLFRVTIELPANVPVGKFTAEVYLFKDTQLLSINTSTLNIQKQGFERIVYSLAFDFPLLYGTVAIFIAVLAGLAASALFRHD